MIGGLYSVATALDAATQNQELVADNLANATTPGFRRHGLLFETLQQSADETASLPASTQAGPSAGDGSMGTRATGHFTSFEPGPMQYTGNPLDLALTGNAFFVLNGPDGPVYTRNGVFRLNDGQLESASGMPVRSQGGRLTIPLGTSRITVSRDGTVYAENNRVNNMVGQLEIAQFPQPSAVLQRVGTTLFAGPAPSPQQSQQASYRVEQGYREGSNVEIVKEMVAMITGMRHYEAAQRALKALGDAAAMNTRPQ